MLYILVVFNKHNIARAASCWFIIQVYYRLVMHGNSKIKSGLGLRRSVKRNINITNMEFYLFLFLFIIDYREPE